MYRQFKDKIINNNNIKSSKNNNININNNNINNNNTNINNYIQVHNEIHKNHK